MFRMKTCINLTFNHWFSKAKRIICTCWFHSGMQRVTLLGNKHSLWPVCLHCAVLMLCWEQGMSSPPDECSLYYYTPPSGSPRRSLSVSAAGGARLRTVSLLGHSPWTVSAPSRLPVPRGNLSSLSPGGPGRCSLLCCIQHRGLGWSQVAVSPVEKCTHDQRGIRLGFSHCHILCLIMDFNLSLCFNMTQRLPRYPNYNLTD